MKGRKPETPETEASGKSQVKRFYRKRVELYLLVNRVRLWVGRSGALHSIRALEKQGDFIHIVTYCGREFTVRNSRNSRAARYLRNKYFKHVCPACGIPEWRLAKYSATRFNRGYGSSLKPGSDDPTGKTG